MKCEPVKVGNMTMQLECKAFRDSAGIVTTTWELTVSENDTAMEFLSFDSQEQLVRFLYAAHVLKLLLVEEEV